ncbi:MAG: crotonyl-CoA carboxylase/reductase [Actinomycetota bacterium]
MGTDLYEIGEIPGAGELPAKMYANLIRPENYNEAEPGKAFTVEVVDTPQPGPRQVVVSVMAAGINYNNVWAAKGIPVDVTKVQGSIGQPTEFHIGGSDAAGVVAAVGEGVTSVKVGDEVIVHCAWFDPQDAQITAGEEPGFTAGYKIWGYETNYGSFGQFCLAYDHQVLPKAPRLTWEEAAAPTLVGATAYRMLMGWPPNTVQDGDPILIWGGSGGLGSMAIQIASHYGGRVVAVVSSDEKGEFCKKLGAVGFINRKEFSHWGVPPHWTEGEQWGEWFQGAKSFGKAFWEALGEKASPKIVFEHPGEDTIPTSIFMAESGGMVVICAGTTGYSATVDLRYLWMRQKRLQGSHFANDGQAAAFNQLVVDGVVDPCMGEVFSFEDIGKAHQLMNDNKHGEGNMVALVSAPERGLKTLA